ncbi:hypothetical protein KQI65_03855 [bacterium]|nr:hypothetical protein [bacterium]
MNYSELAKLELSKPTVLKILRLQPSDIFQTTGKDGLLLGACENIYNLIVQLLDDQHELPIKQFEWTCPHGHTHTFGEDELRIQLLMTMSSWLDVLTMRYILLPSGSKQKDTPLYLSIASMSQFLGRPEDAEPSKLLYKFKVLLFYYFEAVMSSWLLRVYNFHSVHEGGGEKFEDFLHNGLLNVFRAYNKLSEGPLKVAGGGLVHSALELANRLYEVDGDSWADRLVGPFSAIRLSELPALAQREARISEKYGLKQVERIFEQQLALIMQSFGLYVVSTRIAQSTVDLVCISGKPTEQLTFLVEAKSTKSNYSLPTKDSRAIRDYVRDVRRGLSSLPPLSFVLIIIPSSSRTLRDKVLQLQRDVDCPIRVLNVRQLVTLREQIVGPLPVHQFMSHILDGDVIVKDAVIKSTVRGYYDAQRAHTAFVESMFAAHGVIPIQETSNKTGEQKQFLFGYPCKET